MPSVARPEPSNPAMSDPSKFRLFDDPARLPASSGQPVVAIGNFDGVHRGHAAVLDRARSLAARLGRPALALTFEPHPRSYFRPQEPLFRLTSPETKAVLMERAGMDGVVVLPFDRALAETSAESFVDDLLLGRLGVRGVVAGHDFHFGRGRTGTPDFLAAAGAERGFSVSLVPPFALGDEIVSSSAVRRALQRGDVTTARLLLGHDWFVRGPVIHGEKRGRQLGYPTANMRLDESCRLAHGIYAVRARIDGTEHPAVASFGRRPTFDDGAPLLETFVFDFSGDLYGQTIEIAFVAYLRGEDKFDSLDALIRQMDDDSRRARGVLSVQAAVS